MDDNMSVNNTSARVISRALGGRFILISPDKGEHNRTDCRLPPRTGEDTMGANVTSCNGQKV